MTITLDKTQAQTDSTQAKIRARVAVAILTSGGDVVTAGRQVITEMQTEGRALGWSEYLVDGLIPLAVMQATHTLITEAGITLPTVVKPSGIIPGRQCDTAQLLAQIGRGNILSISGGRVHTHRTGVALPAGNGYRVTVDLAADDTYTVKRLYVRGAKVWTKGEEVGVYAELVGDAAYRAACYVNVAFGDHNPNA